MKMMNDIVAENWGVDRGVPLALIVTLLFAMMGQVVAGVAWSVRISDRVGFIEKALERDAEFGSRITELEATSKYQVRVLERIENKLDGIRSSAPVRGEPGYGL